MCKQTKQQHAEAEIASDALVAAGRWAGVTFTWQVSREQTTRNRHMRPIVLTALQQAVKVPLASPIQTNMGRLFVFFPEKFSV